MEQKELIVDAAASLPPVPSVQELAKDSNVNVSRYVRSDHDPFIVTEIAPIADLPIIDMESLLSQESSDAELTKLDFACKEWGFFMLVNHGVSSEMLEKIKVEIQDFYNLPMEEKKKFWQKPGEVEGLGQPFVVSENQKLDWSDQFHMITQPPHLRKPHLFPNLPLPFRETLDNYSLTVKNLALAILEQMEKALKVSTGIKEIFVEGTQQMRFNYYPPCPQSDKVIGLSPHSDMGITVLLQVNDVEGLQIKKNGKWLTIKPIPGAFIINLGDMVEIITNGIYPSVEHRAIVNPKKERLSIAAFHAAGHHCEIGPASSLVTPESPAIFKTVGVGEYLQGFFARELGGKTYLDTLRVKQNEA
ncbi:protein SRG1-like [Tripterygium wilfordii]|uniref:protein SRG1-like n=1 Tax=Tripterygium wilfordii TaxID=458696 RepID=UPI0018F7EC59|nr:protein SRG1-like [Tripterygium wilfordii]